MPGVPALREKGSHEREGDRTMNEFNVWEGEWEAWDGLGCTAFLRRGIAGFSQDYWIARMKRDEANPVEFMGHAAGTLRFRDFGYDPTTGEASIVVRMDN